MKQFMPWEQRRYRMSAAGNDPNFNIKGLWGIPICSVHNHGIKLSCSITHPPNYFICKGAREEDGRNS